MARTPLLVLPVACLTMLGVVMITKGQEVGKGDLRCAAGPEPAD